ncbi:MULTISPECIES: gluconate:H+ symporter [unclassified Curtobacterium]|uniref:GntT/GntP/DsdX family permease n=1 Tax=unclassified Curtobacterium TaxID=257496 RepID=UPI00104388E3|nr:MULTISPECIES: gluconate:H+ symporter [unclassified Curtobacterium]TCU43193.1 GntP family gluconate:H+ symporter [Curtobacterium sp. PhB146]TDW73572.1 GntP family gluconate:H+ symporter [Curtobacterium sp. PhB25]
MSAPELHLVFAAVAIVLLVIGIAKFKLNPFLALLIGALLLGFASGLGVENTVGTFEQGFGDTLSDTAPVIGLGSLLGAILTSTGGANRIADAFIGNRKVALIPISIAVAALVIGLPNIFDVSFVMLVPLAYALARRSGTHLLFVGMPLAAGLYTAHGLLPPHPSPTAAVAAYDASFGLTLALGLVVAIPTVILCGPVLTRVASRWFGPAPDLDAGPAAGSRELTELRPPLWLALGVVLLPPLLLVIGAFGVDATADGTVLHTVLTFCDDPVVALLLAVVVAMIGLGRTSGSSIATMGSVAGSGLKTVGPVLLIIGAGGGLAAMLAETGVSKVIVEYAQGWHVPALILAWVIAALLRIALGSATVATVTAAGIIAPLAAADPSISPELLVLATASGSVMLSHVNDSGFWLFKEYFQLSVKQTFRTWTLMLSLQSVIGLVGVLLLSLVV